MGSEIEVRCQQEQQKLRQVRLEEANRAVVNNRGGVMALLVLSLLSFGRVECDGIAEDWKSIMSFLLSRHIQSGVVPNPTFFLPSERHVSNIDVVEGMDGTKLLTFDGSTDGDFKAWLVDYKNGMKKISEVANDVLNAAAEETRPSEEFWKEQTFDPESEVRESWQIACVVWEHHRTQRTIIAMKDVRKDRDMSSARAIIDGHRGGGIPNAFGHYVYLSSPGNQANQIINPSITIHRNPVQYITISTILEDNDHNRKIVNELKTYGGEMNQHPVFLDNEWETLKREKGRDKFSENGDELESKGVRYMAYDGESVKL